MEWSLVAGEYLDRDATHTFGRTRVYTSNLTPGWSTGELPETFPTGQ
jgi:hypothetical protein